MAGGVPWSRRVPALARSLRVLVRDTRRALDDVGDVLHFEPEIASTVQEIGDQSQRPTTIVIFGTSPDAKARLLHSILGHPLLPEHMPRGCRWIRIQYTSSSQKQVHLSLGNSEFELVEELECNKRPWETLPVEDLLRRDKTDTATILEVEINNLLVKELRILIPPDIDQDPGDNPHLTLKLTHSDLYSKRSSILNTSNNVYLFAIDRIGKNVFSDNLSESIVATRSEEDFWNSCSMYSVGKREENGEVEESGEGEVKSDEKKEWNGDSMEPAVFTSENCLDLHQIKEINPNSQILFVLFSDSKDVNRTEERKTDKLSIDALKRIFRHNQGSSEKEMDTKSLNEEQTSFMNELMCQWEIMTCSPPKHYARSQWLILTDQTPKQCTSTIQHDKCKLDERNIKCRTLLLSVVVKYAVDCMQSYLLEFNTKLSEIHVKLLQQIILVSFDMARELQVVPKKIQYVAREEHQLYASINKKFSEGEKKQELLQLMQEVLQDMRQEVENMDWSVDDLPWHKDPRFTISNSVFYSSETVSLRPERQPSDSEEAASYDSCHFDDYEIIVSADEGYSNSFGKAKPRPAETPPYNNILVENESESMSVWSNVVTDSNVERSEASWARQSCACNALNVSVKQASLDVQQTVLSKLSQKISLKLVNFVDCLKDTYFGTLHRCLESLESCCRQELGGRPASSAMRRLVLVARQVDLSPCASFPLLRSLLESLRRLLYKLRLVGGSESECSCVLSAAWRRRVASASLRQLAPHRLARLISAQILERLSVAHEQYQSALSALETALTNRLHHTEDIKLAIRKKYAPTFARLCLESTSMCDLLMYGAPEMDREIGRGQYGVVYSGRGSWAGHSPVAVKSVLPADERHYRELAMEFFYTRSIPPHPRIVRLLGSIVQRTSGARCVLLVSERKVRDLHSAVRVGLTFRKRMLIAKDIVQGIRYLHSLGLVHRDIKLKNVLLDSADRASLSDLGFCAAEALLSGSVVGTPVHMAPELLAGGYDAAVDVYAFGILFWYVCAGNIRLPSAFETLQNKEQLWSKVKRGLRPERLPHFTDACWDIMESCWTSEPSQRALLGDIQQQLEVILEQATGSEEYGESPRYEVSDDENSLDMTGIGMGM